MRSEAKHSALRTISSPLYGQQVGVFLNKLRTESNITNPFNMQSEFTALQSAIHDLKSLKLSLNKQKSWYIKFK